MKKLNAILKLCVLVLFVAVAVSSCKKSEDPYANYTPENEAALLKSWINKMKADKIDYDSTASKIYYIIDTTKVGTGPKVKSGNTVTVKYRGMFLDGAVFDDSNYHGGTMTYVHKSDPLISGWEEGIELLNKGASAVFLFPSSQAYGPIGSYDGSIPPYTPLIFVIEVVDIK